MGVVSRWWSKRIAGNRYATVEPAQAQFNCLKCHQMSRCRPFAPSHAENRAITISVPQKTNSCGRPSGSAVRFQESRGAALQWRAMAAFAGRKWISAALLAAAVGLVPALAGAQAPPPQVSALAPENMARPRP